MCGKDVRQQLGFLVKGQSQHMGTAQGRGQGHQHPAPSHFCPRLSHSKGTRKPSSENPNTFPLSGITEGIPGLPSPQTPSETRAELGTDVTEVVSGGARAPQPREGWSAATRERPNHS